MTCRIVFLQVGNADCTLVRTPDACAIVDLPKQRPLNDCLKRHEIRSIDRLFVTHDHSDHFLGLERLVNWLESWVRDERPVVALHLPDGLWQRAQERLKELKGDGQVDSRKYQRLQSTMAKIFEWDQGDHVRCSPVSAGHDIADYGPLSFKVLHPSWLEVETQRATRRAAHNEWSLVLRVGYGAFAAVLLADLEGEGLTSLLDRTDRRGPASIRCHVLKIPHHGAWPKNARELVALLEHADPEMAVLSVGSRNSYGHVRPELFRALLDLRNRRDRRLRTFACTEVTRTCALPVAEQSPHGRGLPTPRPCAGDIIVEAETDGRWSWPGEEGHRVTVKSVPLAACLNRAEA
ncbi:MAG: MBL fold metallo-hydrolase [bacterium]|nr:MBL fold metallo-hydrolase [bacterium]